MAISGKRIVLQNNQALRSLDQNGDVQDLIKLDASGEIAGKIKDYIDSKDGIDQSDIDALDGRITSSEGEITTLKGRASALESADVAMDGRVDSLESAMPTKAAQSDLEQEIQDRQDADQALGQRIDNVLSNVDPAALDSLSEVVSAFEQADENLNNAITTLASNASAAVQAEATRALAAEQAISDEVALKAAKSYVDAQDAAGVQEAKDYADSAVQAEAGIRSLADSALDGRLDVIEAALPLKAEQSALEQEIQDRQDGDSALDGRIDSLEIAVPLKASQADLDSLEGRVDVAESDIDSLEGRMGSAESALASLASSSAITELDGRIDVLEAAMPLKALQSDLEQEAQDRQDADAALGVRIDNILSNVDPGSLDSLTEVVQAFEQADQNLNNAITSLASSASSALQSEITRATAAEQALSDAIALKAAKTYVDSQDLAAIQTAKDYADELAAGMTYMHELHVNFDFEGTSDGSPMKPYKSIQDAVDAAVSMNQGANNHIMVHNPNDTVISENIVINNAVTNLFIEGLAHVKDGAAVRIDGSITIQGNSNRVRLKGLSVISPSSSTPALSVVGTPGRHIFEKCAFEVGGVSFSGTYQNWSSFVDCSLEGPVVFGGTPAANTLITMYGLFGGQADITVNSANVIVSLMDSYSLKSLTHSAGTLAVDNLRSIGSAGIVSTASSGFMSLTRVSMQQPDLSFAPINKSGSAPYQLISVHRGETGDTLSGTRVAFGPTATDSGYKMAVSGNWSSAVYSVGAALDSLAANKATTASVTSGLAGKASTTLNNLGTTSINADLLPSADATRSLGTPALGWAGVNARFFQTTSAANTPSSQLTHASGYAQWTSVGTSPAPIKIATGNHTSAASGSIFVQTGSAPANMASGSVVLTTAAAAGTGNSGNISLQTGTVATGIRGSVSIVAGSVALNNIKMTGLANGVASSDAAAYGQVTTAQSAAQTYADGVGSTERTRALAAESALSGRVSTVEALQIPKMEYYDKVLTSGDLVSIDVGYTIVGTPMVMIEGVMGRPGIEFTVSGSVITFSGEWLYPSGLSAVAVGDKVHVYYMRTVPAFN